MLSLRLCASACPFDALEFKINDKDIKEMEEYPKWTNEAEIDTESCIYCKACEQHAHKMQLK